MFTNNGLVIPKDSVINGFCFAYAEALVEKLKSLGHQGKTFKEKTADDESGELTEIAYAVIQRLHEQIPSPAAASNHLKPKKLGKYVATAEEFLSIFKKKAPA